jgi:uncharacterized protein (DUF2267 family)
MSEERIAMFDTTVQKANEWVGEVAAELQISSRLEAFRALRAVLQTLRDQLDPPQVAQLASQMTPLLTGVLYEGWRPGHDGRAKTAEEFLAAVVERHGARPFKSPEDMVTGVTNVLQRHISGAELGHVLDRLPRQVVELFRERVIG